MNKLENIRNILYLAINHEVAPKSQALKCKDCHVRGIDFKKLGYKRDPIKTGGRFK